MRAPCFARIPEAPDGARTVRICVSVSAADVELLKGHRAETGESASGFVRRMVSESLSPGREAGSQGLEGRGMRSWRTRGTS